MTFKQLPDKSPLAITANLNIFKLICNARKPGFYLNDLNEGGIAPFICDKTDSSYAIVILFISRNLPKIALNAHRLRPFSVNPFGARAIFNFPIVNLQNLSFLQNCLSFSEMVFVIRNLAKTINIGQYSGPSNHTRKN